MFIRWPILLANKNINIILEGSLDFMKTKRSVQHFSFNVTVLHACVLTMLKCISMQNLIEIYRALQKL